MAIPVDPQSHINTKVERLLQENTFLRKNQQVFASLTKREKEILRLVALGNSTNEIAEQLHISIPTAFTHRRNLKSKLKAQTNYDLTRFAQAFDLI
jgi:DNA-binding CsgD family transcriptional regulator